MIGSSSEQQQAATGDTWGIPGPDFLNYYLVAAAVGLLLVLIVRRSVTRGRSVHSLDQLDPEQVGYLAGSRPQAYFAALTALRTQGLVSSAGKGMITAQGSKYVRLSELQHSIVSVAGKGAKTSKVQADPRLTGPMSRIRDGLASAGLLTTAAQRAACRLVALLLVAVEAVGVARIVAGSANAKPFANLAIVMVVLGVVTLFLLAVVPTRTAAGSRALRKLRSTNGHLRVSQHPSWATYGPMGAGLSVALFGATALFAIDPAFASAASIPRTSGGGSTFGNSDYGGSGGGDGGGGSSCGGGGCGGGGCGG